MKLLVERKLKGVEACGRSALVGRGVVVIVVVVVVDVVAPRTHDRSTFNLHLRFRSPIGIDFSRTPAA